MQSSEGSIAKLLTIELTGRWLATHDFRFRAQPPLRLSDLLAKPLFVAIFLGFDHFNYVIVLLPFDDVFEVKLFRLAVELYVQAPAGCFVYVRSVNGFFVTFDTVKPRFWILPRLMTRVVFELRECTEKLELERMVRKDLVAFVDDPVLIKESLNLSHHLALSIRRTSQDLFGRWIERGPYTPCRCLSCARHAIG